MWPTNPEGLGHGFPSAGQGGFSTHFIAFEGAQLRGVITIEREISGPQQL